MIIAIDGPSGTGKSTVAKGVAKKLGFTFFDTGAMYRSLAWFILKEKINPLNQEAVEAVLPNFHFEMQTKDGGEKHYIVSGIDITHEIRTQVISMTASQIAVYEKVRDKMVKIQRRFGHAADAVFEGRDMGTVVFPDADLKIFLTAKPEVRAKRRYQELMHKFPDALLSFDEILQEIKTRDETDSTRAISPLKKGTDAQFIDTSNLTAEQVIERIVRMKPKQNLPNMKWSYKIVCWVIRIFFKCFFRLKIYGSEHFRSGAALIAANHASFYDPPVLSIACPEEVHFLAKGSLFEVPILGRLIKTLNSHPVARGVADFAVLRTMIELLQEGKKLILFPEGKRSETGDLLPLQRGIAFLAQKGECRIIPAYIQGTHEAWPPGKKMPKLFGKMAVVFGSPIEWEEGRDSKTAQEELTLRVEKAIRDLKNWLEAGAHGTPP